MKQVYVSEVVKQNGVRGTFSCLASSLAQAGHLTIDAGYSGFSLLGIRVPLGVELDEVAELEVLANPFLGAEWMPFINAIAPKLKAAKPRKHWVIDFKVPELETIVPFMQAMNLRDGRLALEISTLQLDQEADREKFDYLVFSGWLKPDEGGPLYYRLFDAGANPRHVLAVGLEALVVLFGLKPGDSYKTEGEAIGRLVH